MILSRILSSKNHLLARTSLTLPHHPLSSMAPNQTVYIVTAIHCPSTDGINPNCYSITGAYSSAPAAQAAMLAKAKELYTSPVTHFHGQPKKDGHPSKGEAEWKEGPFKVEFKGNDGDFGVCWVDERVLGVEEMPITQALQLGRFGMGHKGEAEGEDWGMSEKEVERTICGVLRF